jgi:hypothetical protein
MKSLFVEVSFCGLKKALIMYVYVLSVMWCFSNSCKGYSLFLMGLLIVFFSFNLLGTVYAQGTSFTSQDIFSIPDVNGSIRFSVNGYYSSAVLENDTWVFNDLTLSGSRTSGTLKFSAKNCNVIIQSFMPIISDSDGGSSNVSRRSSAIRYTVDGVGEQVVNIGRSSSKPSHPGEWSVIQGSVFFGEGKTWKLLPDDTLIIRGVSGNLTVVRYNFGNLVDDRPYHLRHSISITTATIVVVTVTFATVIKLKTTKRRLSA